MPNSKEILQTEWSAVKQEIQNTWSGLSADDLEQTHGDVHEIAELVHDKYGLDTDDAERKLEDVIARCGTAAGKHSISGSKEQVSLYGTEGEDYEQDSDTETFGTPGLSGTNNQKLYGSRSSELEAGKTGSSSGSEEGSKQAGSSSQSERGSTSGDQGQSRDSRQKRDSSPGSME